MRLQLALDDISLENGLALLEKTQDNIQIVEVGTPMIIEYGMLAVRKIREAFPKLLITADAKIMDAGEYEAAQCFRAGADIVTVMGFTHDETIAGAVKAAKDFGKEIMADLMALEGIGERAVTLRKLGVSYACVHAAVDRQALGESPYEELVKLSKAISSENCCIAGGVNIKAMPEIVALKPEIIIVGAALSKAENPAATAKALREAMQA